jgi:hypothetical protein
MNGRKGQRQGGSSLSEQLFVCAVVAFYCVLLAVSFNRSLAAGFGMIGLTLAIGLLIFAYAWRRERQAQRKLVEDRRSDLARAAAEHHAAVDTVFMGRGEGWAFSAFGVAGAAGKLIFARETDDKERTRVLEFDQLAAAFARPDGGKSYRLEVRTRAGGDRSPRAVLFLRVEERAEAERWVRVLQPHLGERVRFVETADAPP